MIAESINNDDILFIDFFTDYPHRRVGLSGSKNMTTLACRDVIFPTTQPDQLIMNPNSNHQSVWFLLARKFELNLIILPDNRAIYRFSCQDLDVTVCRPKTGYISPPCCHQELSAGLKFVNQIFGQYPDILTEIVSGNFYK